MNSCTVCEYGICSWNSPITCYKCRYKYYREDQIMFTFSNDRDLFTERRDIIFPNNCLEIIKGSYAECCRRLKLKGFL